MRFYIEPVETAHIEDLLDFCAELSAADGTAPFDRDAMRASANALLNDPKLGQAVWIKTNGERAGYLVMCFGWSFEFGGRTALLEHLYVRESFRRQGVASAALAWAEALCLSEAIGLLYLGVEASNRAAQDLYSKHGFENYNLFFWMKRLDPTALDATTNENTLQT